MAEMKQQICACGASYIGIHEVCGWCLHKQAQEDVKDADVVKFTPVEELVVEKQEVKKVVKRRKKRSPKKK